MNIRDATIIEGSSYLFMHFDRDDPDRAQDIVQTVNSRWSLGRAYTPADAPVQWHVDNNPRFPDVILMPEPGFAVLSTAQKAAWISVGDHGWAPGAPAMHGFLCRQWPKYQARYFTGLCQRCRYLPTHVVHTRA